MKSTISQVHQAGKHMSPTVGIMLICTGLLAAVLCAFDARLVFVPFGLLGFVWVCHLAGVASAIPREPIGWLYASIIFMTCWAPSLGTTGTLARFGLAGLAVAAAIALAARNQPPLPVITKCALAILLLSLSISSIGAASGSYGLTRLLNWIMFLPLVLLVYRRPNVKGAVFGIVVTCAFQMGGVGLQMAGLMGGTWGGLLTSGTTYNPETSSWLRRYTGFIGNPNNLALVLACGVIVLAACLLSQITVRLKLVCIGLIGLFVVGVVMTGSRGGLVAVGLGLMVLFLATGRRGIGLALMAASVAATTIQLGSSEGFERIVASFNEILSGTDASAAQRSDVWIARLRAADESSLTLGSGFGGYAPSLFANQHGLDIDGDVAKLATVDNSWLKLLLECGIVGATAMATILLYPMLRAILGSSGHRRLWGIASAAIISTLIWRSISVDMYDQNPWNAITFLAIGFATASFKSEPRGAVASDMENSRVPAFVEIRPR